MLKKLLTTAALTAMLITGASAAAAQTTGAGATSTSTTGTTGVSATPGTPNTGAGGAAEGNILLLVGSALAVVGGTAYLARRAGSAGVR
ncbi:MAG: hypothetical protein KGI78_03410 [Patescibacteria group bacterium]|nr:hypothetical protein [Patescibacteria group bacterium]